MSEDIAALLRDSYHRVERCRAALEVVLTASDAGRSPVIAPINDASSRPAVNMQTAIYDALNLVSSRCAEYYAQAYFDLADPGRISWIGTVHQVRETLATVLRILASDDAVKAMAWFKPETDDGKPSQRQRVRFILQQRSASSTERKVAEQIDLIDDRIADMVRATYFRASTFAHIGAERRDALTILRYFEAFAHDLLDIE